MAKVCFVIPCMGRLATLKGMLGSVAAQPDSSCIVVDYSCPEHCGDWVEANYPQVRVVRIIGEEKFSMPRAMNEGIRQADTPWICQCNADILVDLDFGAKLFPTLEPGCFYHAPLEAEGICGMVLFTRQDFDRTGGFDELYCGWGDEDIDFYAALVFIGSQARELGTSGYRHLPHSEEARVQFHDIKQRWFSWAINRIYRYLKYDAMRLTGAFLTPELRKSLYAHITQSVTDALLNQKDLELKLEITKDEDLLKGWKFDRSLVYKYRKA